jgi:hypothetical protein
MFKRSNLVDPMERGAVNFWGSISNNVTLRSYGYFPKFTIFIIWIK